MCDSLAKPAPSALFASSARAAGPRSQEATAHYALAVLYNGAGNYTAACEAAVRSNELGELVKSSLTLPELVESAARSDEMARAREASEELTARAAGSATPWALGLAAPIARPPCSPSQVR